MIARIVKWEDGMALCIPASLARTLAFEEGRAVEMTIEGGRLIMSPLDPVPATDLESLLDRITPENLHAEIDFGAQRGHEAF